MPLVDLSRLTKLKDVALWCPEVQRITVTLQTAESINVEQIIIELTSTFRTPLAGPAHRKWEDLDRLLLQFWTSHSIRPQIKLKNEKYRSYSRGAVLTLFPELTGRGIVDLVEDRLLERR